MSSIRSVPTARIARTTREKSGLGNSSMNRVILFMFCCSYFVRGHEVESIQRMANDGWWFVCYSELFRRESQRYNGMVMYGTGLWPLHRGPQLRSGAPPATDSYRATNTVVFV